MQTMNSWKRQGYAEGREEGQHQLLMTILYNNFGELTPELETRVKELSCLQLTELSPALRDIKTHADLINWLDNQKK